MLRRLLSSERFWLLAGIVIAVLWFGWNSSLPGIFRGTVCCDSTYYINMAGTPKLNAVMGSGTATGITTVSTGKLFFHYLFEDASYRTIGYPLFLAAHRYGLSFLHLGGLIDWMFASTVTALLLHILSSLFFYRSLKYLGWNVHPVILFLIVAHPGLTSHAALPLSDSLSVSLVLFASACLARSLTIADHLPIRPSARAFIIYPLLTGLFFASSVWVRSANFLAAEVTLIAWLLIVIVRHAIPMLQRAYASRWQRILLFCWSLIKRLKTPQTDHRWWLLPALALLSFFVILSPRLIACTRDAGSLCLIRPSEQSGMIAELFERGLGGARTYTAIQPAPPLPQWPEKQITVRDSYFAAHLKPYCPIKPESAGHDLITCFARTWIHWPVFLGKKLIGLFDNFHLNSYATYVTPFWVLIYSRIFGMIAFAGFVLLILSVFTSFFFKRVSESTSQRALFVLFPLTYAAYSALLTIESRYGLLLVPFGLAGLAVTVHPALKQWKKRRWTLCAAAVLMLLFIVQTSLWDAADVIPHIPLSEIR